MGGSQKNIGQGKDDAITNPIRQKPSRRNGLQRKRQQKIPVPKSKENDAITNSLLKCKKQTIHKAVRSPTHYLHSQEDESFARRCDHLPAISTPKTGGKLLHQPIRKKGYIQSFNIHKFSETNGREVLQSNFQKKRKDVVFFCKMHTLIDTNGVASNHEPGRK